MSNLAVIEALYSTEQESFADEQWRLFLQMANPSTAADAAVKYWANILNFFSPFPAAASVEATPWSSANKLQITYVAAQRRMAALFLEGDANGVNFVDRLHKEYKNRGAELNLLPPSIEALKSAAKDILHYGEMIYSSSPSKEPEIAFGPYINLSDLAKAGAFKGTAKERKDCRWLNLEHCMFNGDLNTTISMQYADMKYSNLRHANLRGCDLSHSDFCGADLRGADLRDAKLDGILYDSYTTVDHNTKLPNHFTAHYIVEEKGGERLGQKGSPGQGFDTQDTAFLRKNPNFRKGKSRVDDPEQRGKVIAFRPPAPDLPIPPHA